MNKIFILLISLLLTMSDFSIASEIEPITASMRDRYKRYRKMISDEAVDAMFSVRSAIEFKEGDPEHLLNIIAQRIMFEFQVFKSDQIYILSFMALYDVLSDDDEFLIYPTGEELHKIEKDYLKTMADLSSAEGLLEEFRQFESEKKMINELTGERDKRFDDVYTRFNMLKGKIHRLEENKAELELKFDYYISRRTFLLNTLKLCAGKIDNVTDIK